MKKIVLIASVLLLIFSACNAPSKKKEVKNVKLSESEMLRNIQQDEKAMFSGTATKIDKKLALKLVEEYQQYANRFPDDTITPEYLFKASDISMNMGTPRQTIAIFDKLINKYPDFNKISTCYFLRAFVYDDQLKDYKNAKQYYKDFLKRFPDSDFADDAQMLLNNLGKTPEELINEFGKK